MEAAETGEGAMNVAIMMTVIQGWTLENMNVNVHETKVNVNVIRDFLN